MKILPMSVVVVVLPLDPVTATTAPSRKRLASSSSPRMVWPKALAWGDLRGFERHAGRDDDQVLAAEGEEAVTARLDHDAGVEQGGDLLGERPLRIGCRRR